MRSAVRLLWGLLQEQQMKIKELQTNSTAGSELLESLSVLLSDDPLLQPQQEAADTR